MSNDWDEIKRLAADFQKVQLTSTLQRLSERNCIEIVTLLLEKGLVDVVFTNDGKEYITPDHLQREILDELYVHGGRVNLVELSKILTVDLSKIDVIAEKISKENPQIHFMLGQLIDEDYITRIATEINEKLSQYGEITISELTVQFDLPSDFLQHNVVEKHLGKIIRGRQDPNNSRVFFTQAYISRCKGKIRGALAALTRPTLVSAILQQIHVQEKIFHSLLDEIMPSGSITSKLANAQYIPHVYAKMQIDWVQSFYSQNGFLEYSAVSKLGISDPKQFIKKLFPNESITFLSKCAVGSKITDLTLTSALNECNLAKSYVDLSTILPTNMSDEDIEELFTSIITSKSVPNNFVYLDTTVFSNQYLNELIQPCYELAKMKAFQAVEIGTYQQYILEKQSGSRAGDHDTSFLDSKTEKRDERRKKAASGKGGGGTQGRETKTKSTKKHQRGDKTFKEDNDEDDARSSKKSAKMFELVSAADIDKAIVKKLAEEGLEHLSKQIAAMYHSQINQFALQTAQQFHESTPQTNRRQNHTAVQEKLNVLLSDIRLYEKGLKLLPGDVQHQLVKYLLKTLGSDISNEIALYIANECNLNVKSSQLTTEQRAKIAQECEIEYRAPLMDLNKTVSKGSIEEFLSAAEVALKACSMIIKKIDKKKDKTLIVLHKEKLIEQLRQTDDSALMLHLTVLIIFTSTTNCILHASGKFVPQILQFLSSHLNQEQYGILQTFYDLVLKLLSAGSDSDEGKAASEQLKSLQKGVCDLATTYEKPGITKSE